MHSVVSRPELQTYPHGDKSLVSPGQLNLWLHDQRIGTGPRFVIPIAVRLRGRLDAVALAAALGDVQARHEILRTVYTVSADWPVQRVLDPPPADEVLTTVRCDEAELPELLLAAVREPFELAADRPVRATLHVLGPEEHLLLLCFHHIAFDGSSIAPFARDLITAYDARCRGEEPDWQPLPVQYRDYAVWQERLTADADDPTSPAGRQLAFWREQLAGLPEVLTLPADRPRPAETSNRGGHLEIRWTPELRRAMSGLAKQSRVSPFMVVQAALAALLTRTGAGTDIPIGIPVAGRTEDALEDLVGFFVNTLVLRTDTAGDPTFGDLLRRVRRADLAALTHSDVPFRQVVQAVAPDRGLAHSPLFQVMLAFQNVPQARLELPGLEVTVESVSSGGTAPFDLAFYVWDWHAADRSGASDGTVGFVEYNDDIFDRETVQALLDRLEGLLQSVSADPGQRLSEIDLFLDDERPALLTGADVPVSRSVPEVFAEQARATPDAVAVVAVDGRLTYARLDARANRLARKLVAHGAGPETVVALALPRTTDLIVALLAVLKAGAAYLPIEPDLPAERVAFMLADVKPVVVVDPAFLVGLDELVADDLGVRPHPRHPAYVIYTSGSTGTPKGVLLEHRGLANMLAHHTAQIFDVESAALGRRLRVALTAAMSFDTSWEGPLAMVAGHELHLIDDDRRRDAHALVKYVAREGVDLLDVTPSYARILLDAGLLANPATAPPALMLGGESVDQSLWDSLREATGTVTYNYYGPTECTVDTVWCRLAESPRPVIGRPLWNTRAYVLDEYLRPLPPGVPGELYLAGVSLARGYLGRPGLTAERFVADPFHPGRMYRTGDRVRLLADGRIDYLGRTDRQVKVRGFRIELGEVEAALRSVPGVRDAVALVDTDGAGQPRLVGYAAGEVTEAAVRAALSAALPHYLVPSAIVVLERIPVTSSGKADQAALPPPTAGPATGRAPATETERVLCDLFAEVLDRDSVGVDDNFFAHGGHSLTATRLISRIRAVLGAELPLKAVFRAPTVAELADQVAAAAPARSRVRHQERPDVVPLSYAQHRLWLLNHLDPTDVAYNIPLALRLTGPLDVEAMRRALADVQLRHESLRTVFPETDGEPHQLLLGLDDGACPLRVAEPAGELGEAITAASAEPFDLSREVPLRAHLFRAGPEQHVLLLVLHHIAGDGVSLQPLATDLATAYDARRSGREPAWAPLPVQSADHALWQRAYLEEEDGAGSRIATQLAFWQRTLADLPEEIPLPADRPRPTTAGQRGGVLSASWDRALHAGLSRLTTSLGTSLFSAVQAGLAALLTRLGAGTDVPIGTAVSGRDDIALEELIGFFVNTLVLRTDTSGDPTFAELVTRTAEADLAAFAHQDVPFERVVEALNPPRLLNRHPLFQVALVLQRNALPSTAVAGLRIEPMAASSGAAKFDLTVEVDERYDPDGSPDGIDVLVDYSADRFDARTVQALVDRLTRLLATAVAEPDLRLSELDLLNDAERETLDAVNRTRVPLDGTLIPELIGRQAARRPESTAVVCGAERLTYRQLLERADALAVRLRAAGVGPDVAVGLCLPRAADMAVAVVGVLRAGGAFVPMDADQPGPRLRAMVVDSGAALVLANARTLERASELGVPLLRVDPPSGVDAPPPPDALPWLDDLRPEHLGYVLFTSGSTGRPKGVAVAHSALANLAVAVREPFHVDAGDRMLQFVSFGFDVAVSDFVFAFVAGAELHIAVSEERLGDELFARLRDSRINYVFLPPSAAMSLPPGELPDLRTMAVGGEACPAELVRRWAAPGRRILDAYGPSEDTVYATTAVLEPGEPVVVGRPVANTRAYVLDEHLRMVPFGVPGEVYLAGDGLARGYAGQPGMTAERFVADPFGEPGSRMYRVGDLARWTTDGDLEYLGRVDHQVKLRGVRIELGEIESVLGQFDRVRQVAVIVREDIPGDPRLVAYVVPDAPDAGLPERLRADLRRHLPDQMVPSSFVLLDALPVTKNGKLDRRALPSPEVTTGGGRRPRTRAERILAELFAETLGVTSVSVDDNFFHLGGHSLLATKLIRRVRARLGQELAMRSVFDAPTVAELAVRLDGDGGDGEGFDVLLPLRVGDRGRTPLFCLHTGHGISWSYSSLLQHLGGDVPVYGVQARGLTEPENRAGTMAEMVDDYLAAIRSVQPHGPYQFLGWSFGGVVAHALATRLRAEGEQVALLAMMDAYPAAEAERGADSDEEYVARLLRDEAGITDRAELAYDRQARERLLDFLRGGYGELTSMVEGRLLDFVDVYAGNCLLRRHFDPEVFDGDLLYFAAARTDELTWRLWQPYVTGRFEVHEIPAGHDQLMNPEPAAAIGRTLASKLR
ncbi:amino acid adenylation domain-containing protein [Micromonospora sp. NPDC000089]|uniref:amino acid adenylation domain-containing protein n=1 Tax=unclassified Micromonospora TaxID=2617518 RepID=UPI00367DFD7B